MRAWDHLRIAGAVALIAWLIYSTQVPTGSDPDALMMNFVDSYVSRGRAAIDAYSEHVEKQLAFSLKRLFDQLDTDADGCIRKDEFKGVSLGLLAAVQSFEVPDSILPEIDTSMLPQVSEHISLLRRVVGLQLLFLVFLFVAENVKSLIMPEPMVFEVADYKNAKPRHASKDEALVYDTPMTRYEKMKMLFFIVSGVFFLRVFLSAFFFLAGILLLNLSTYGGRSRERNPLWFHVFGTLTKAMGFLALASMGFYHIRTLGQPARRSQAKLLLGNHVCMVELIVMFLQADFPSFVSRIENLEIPLFRGIARTANAIMVDRSAASSRQQTVAEIARRSRAADGAQLMLFPEGTCNNQRALFQFKRGAFEPGQPVQIICFHFPYKHFNCAWTGRAGGGNDMPDLLLRMCTQFVNRLDVVYLPVYRPSEEEVHNPPIFARHCQQMMAHVLGVPTSDATFEDYAAAARQYNRTHLEGGSVVGTETPQRAGEPHDVVPRDVATPNSDPASDRE